MLGHCGQFERMDVSQNAVKLIIKPVQIQHSMWIFEFVIVVLLPFSLNSIKQIVGLFVSFVELLQDHQVLLLESCINGPLGSSYVI